MAVEDILPTILLVAVIYFIIRWFTKSSTETRSDGSIPGVTPAMVQTVHAAFPDIPLSNIVYHLAKTRSAQATSEEILERGFLPSAPASYTIPASLTPPNVNPPSAPSSPARSSTSTSTSTSTSAAAKVQANLIERYGLSAKVPSKKGKEKESSLVLTPTNPGDNAAMPTDTNTDTDTDTNPAFSAHGRGGVSGKWEDTREGRERGLKERKERMILEARRRLIEKQERAQAGAEAQAQPSTAA